NENVSVPQGVCVSFAALNSGGNAPLPLTSPRTGTLFLLVSNRPCAKIQFFAPPFGVSTYQIASSMAFWPGDSSWKTWPLWWVSYQLPLKYPSSVIAVGGGSAESKNTLSNCVDASPPNISEKIVWSISSHAADRALAGSVPAVATSLQLPVTLRRSMLAS